MNNRVVASAAGACERALEAIRTRVSVSGPIGIAYSGGLDSSALLHLSHAYARSRGIGLFAFHIHHGISEYADDWLAHCERECAQLGIPFAARRVRLVDAASHGVEAAARLARYAALGDLCRQHAVPLLLTAHHRDDQAETLLLQLLRGSGTAGLAAMETENAASGLLGGASPVIGRPLLAVARAELADYVGRHAIRYVDDESNADPRYARNALRAHVMPVLDRHFPGFQQRLLRSAGHARAAQRLLNVLARQDLAQCRSENCIDIDRLRLLGADRIDNVLRFWLAEAGMRMPSSAWLTELRTQLLDAREDARVRVTHADCEIRRHRNRLYLTPRHADAIQHSVHRFRWEGQPEIRFAQFGGKLYFDSAGQGIDAGWLREQELHIRYRSGGEMLKPGPNRSTRSLKHHYQALDIPSWERERLPLVTAGEDLLFAAGIGMNWGVLQAGSGQCIRLRWEFG